MGQAKLRGTYEERKEKAIQKQKQYELKLRLAKKALIDRRGKSQTSLLLAAAMAISVR